MDEEEIVAALEESFPDVFDELDHGEGACWLLGGLAIALREGLESGSLSDETIDSMYDMLNRIGETSDDRVANLLATCALEILTDSKQAMAVSRQKLSGQALELFEIMVEFWQGKRG